MNERSLSGSVPDAALESELRVFSDAVRLNFRHWRGSIATFVLVTAAVIWFGRDHAPRSHWSVWTALVSANTLGQAVLLSRLEKAAAGSRAESVVRCHRWLVANFLVSSSLYGYLPFLVSSAAPSLSVFACLFNALMAFTFANAPGTRGIVLAGTGPMLVMGTAALALRLGDLRIALGYAVLLSFLILYGLRIQAATWATTRARQAAEDALQALAVNQRQLVEVERDRALLLERQRLTRDMHDGLGSALAASLAAVERGDVQPARLAVSLRDCIDDLRTVLDSLDPMEHDLVALLATLRHRMERRLETAGIRSVWRVGELPPLEWLGPSEALHVMRIVQEVLNNAIRHSCATSIRFATKMHADKVEVEIADNGIGFDRATRRTGRGLGHLEQRAAALGAALAVDSQPGGGTRVVLTLDVARPHA